jgi:hypothetical protein
MIPTFSFEATWFGARPSRRMFSGLDATSSIFIVTSFSAETQSTSKKRYIKCQYLALAYPGGAGLYSPNTHSVPVCIAAAPKQCHAACSNGKSGHTSSAAKKKPAAAAHPTCVANIPSLRPTAIIFFGRFVLSTHPRDPRKKATSDARQCAADTASGNFTAAMAETSFTNAGAGRIPTESPYASDAATDASAMAV